MTAQVIEVKRPPVRAPRIKRSGRPSDPPEQRLETRVTELRLGVEMARRLGRMWEMCNEFAPTHAEQAAPQVLRMMLVHLEGVSHTAGEDPFGPIRVFLEQRNQQVDPHSPLEVVR